MPSMYPFGNAVVAVGFTPVTNTYDNLTGSETVPSNATTLVVEVYGPGGVGRTLNVAGGIGGGGGGYSKKTLTIASADWSQTIPYNSTNTVSSTAGSKVLTNGTINLTANSGQSGLAGGAGGTASGGDVNTTGSAHGAGSSGGAAAGPAGGAGGTQPGPDGVIPGGGGAGANTSIGETGGSGAVGRVVFAWT